MRNPVGLAATLRDRMPEALLYRDLARLRTTADGVVIPQQDVDELEWHGADRARWTRLLRRMGPGPAAVAAAPLAAARAARQPATAS